MWIKLHIKIRVFLNQNPFVKGSITNSKLAPDSQGTSLSSNINATKFVIQSSTRSSYFYVNQIILEAKNNGSINIGVKELFFLHDLSFLYNTHFI